MPYVAKRANRKGVVIVGSGWAGATLSTALDEHKFKITIVSPEETTPYTPLLASAACGLYDFSIVETSIRHQARDVRYIKASVEDVEFDSKTCKCMPAFDEVADTAPQQFGLPYDYLILAPGCTNNTFGTPGVAENAMFVRTARDAKAIQTRIRDCFEIASIPGLSGEQIRDILHFVIVGAGPTGVEISSELSDLFHGDFARLYPHVKKHVRISVHDIAPNVLGGFDQNLQEYAMESFDRRDVEVVTGSHIEKVDSKAIYTKELGRIPCGAVIWSTGNKVTPLVENLRCKKSEHGLPRMLTDEFLRLKANKGGIMSDVFALGDAADIEGSSLPTTAEVACQKGKWLATAMNAEFKESRVGHFEYKQAPIVAYLGHSDGVIAGKSDYTGAEAWVAWRSKNFLWTRTWRQRVLVVVSWVLDRLTGRTIAPR
ncbi:FAD/NAD(P)-binding domain-containing protein [Cryphonectria parasitica EP155]|uniref:FAD/NAD(P)-binding domain-containing protein n=1 Tax=Cryphonectria parasitica (strain ATCC 38755 / EP155) TaxID=660469 RepID=A0A9P4XUJ4_CRYP1|nr:FAD/NAD(P)-binding domain-containing protein [Cryphonectria parasitica EP155]KAF3761248.1 FAD/NAD(P)-binding domain-containing protein [Cryphonectria parasitica EP155]